MRFGEKLQGKLSHEALVSLQDAEIRLLENIKKCLTLRIRIDQQYANGLSEIVSIASKLDASEFKNPVFQCWNTIVRETEIQQHLIQENSNHLFSHTLDRLLHLIEEKKATRKFYIEERQRLEVEFAKLQEETQKHKGEYEKCMEKFSHEREKYKDMCAKGKPGSKVEDSKNRYIKVGSRLHKVHNDYVISIHDVTLHQLHYLSTTLPGLLDYQQEVQESTVKQSKGILEEYANLTNLASDNFSTCHRRITQSIGTVSPSTEYTEFMEKHKSEPLESAKFAFDRKLLNQYNGNLKADEIQVDNLTIDTLNNNLSTFGDKLTTFRNRKETKEIERQTLEENIAKKPPDTELSEPDRLSYQTQMRAVQVLKKEIVELNCLIEKHQNLQSLLNNPLSQVDQNIPDAGLIHEEDENLPLPESPPPPDNSSSGSLSRTPQNFMHTIRKKLGGVLKSPQPTPLPSLAVVDSPPSPTLNNDRHYTPPPITPRPDSAADSNIKRKSSASDGYQQAVPEEEEIQMTLQPDSQLEDMEWFHGVLPREEVQRLLVKDGDFLVRESKHRKTGQQQYVLSVMWSGHKHFIIQGQVGSWRFEGQMFPTIPELVENQLRSKAPVTNKSQAILFIPIVREDWELNNDDIEQGEKIDNGHFGEVFRGSYKVTKQEVAIKICRETLSDEAKKKFLQEGRILKQYDHPNIVRFIGIAAQRQPVMIVMEFVPGGSLLKYLQSKGQQQTAKELMKMCEDAAAGMDYLEQKGCIHRDLAARNCLVGKNKIIKISDFGMSREEEVYKVSDGLKQIPIKWTAPEALNLGEYTSMCDVWSYGVLMWEVFSFGDSPYNGLTNNQAREKIETGYRMPAPQGTPELVHALMLRCWDAKPQNRPHFAEIKEELSRLRTVL